MAEYIMDWNRKIPKPCEDCDPCIELDCKHIYRATARKREEIVRCRDCEYYDDSYGCETGLGDCHANDPNGFCAWGVKRSRTE